MGGRGSLDEPALSQQQQIAAGQQGKQQQAATAEVLAQPSLQPFLQQNFNAAEFTSHVLASSRTSAQAHAEQLKQGVRQLEQALSTHVIFNHHELLQHARRLADTEHSLQDVVLSVSSLQASVKRIRAEMEGPYVQVGSRGCAAVCRRCLQVVCASMNVPQHPAAHGAAPESLLHAT